MRHIYKKVKTYFIINLQSKKNISETLIYKIF